MVANIKERGILAEILRQNIFANAQYFLRAAVKLRRVESKHVLVAPAAAFENVHDFVTNYDQTSLRTKISALDHPKTP